MGWTYNADPDVPTNAGGIVAVGVFFTLVSLVVVGLRVYVRARVVRNLIIDDWIIVGTWFTSLVFMSITLAQTRWGLGLRNQVDMPIQNVTEFGHLQYAGAPFYILSLFGFKLSILFSFLRQAVDITYRKAIIAVILSLGTFHFLYFVIQLGICNPVAKQWNPSLPGTCIPQKTFHIVTSVLTLFFNFFVLATPVPLLIFALPTISILKRYIIAAIYTLALFTSLIQIPRIIAIRTSNSTSLLTWSIVETNLGITSCSILSLAPLFASLLQTQIPRPASSIRSFSSSNNTNTKTTSLKRAKERLSRIREDSEVWRRIERFLGYGELQLPRHNHNLPPGVEVVESRPGTSLSSRMGSRMEMIGNRIGMGIVSRMGSVKGSRRGSLDDYRGGTAHELDWTGDFGGIVLTTEIIVSRESMDINMDTGDGRVSRSGSVTGVQVADKMGSGKGSPLKSVSGQADV